MPKINIVGWYDKKNVGDESYKVAFPLLFPDLELTFSDTPQSADAYVLGGGDIIVPSFLNPMAKISAPKSILSVSINAKTDTSTLKNFKHVFVRDNESLKLAKKAGVDATFCPDFAFTLNADKVRGAKIVENYFAKEKAERYEKVIGVVVNSHLSTVHNFMASDAFQFENFCFEMAKTLDETNASFIFIPFGKAMPWDDRCSNSIVASRCKFWKKNVMVYDEMSVQDTLDVMASLDCMISTRLHSSIFSFIGGVPLLDITHNHKNKNLLETLGKEEMSLPFRSFNARSGKERLNEILSHREEIAEDCRRIGESQKNSLLEISKNVCFI